MRILGIETSCDDTSSAVVENGTTVLSNVVSSQIKIHKKYKGIVPELASRHHLENINYVVEKALSGSGKIDAVAVTVGPGLIGSLLIGTTTAQAISEIMRIPIVGINHIEGHIFSNYPKPGKFAYGKPKVYPVRSKMPKASADAQSYRTSNGVKFPYLALIISGGHTDLILVERFGRYKILGRTRDDAVGEVFDKVAKYLDLGYPGGPVIDKLAKKGDASKIKFPRPYMPGTWDFSFSGLKTAVINYADRFKIPHKSSPAVCDICASFQQACVDVLVRKTLLAVRSFGIKNVILGGGVSSNSQIRSVFIEKGKDENINISMPPFEFCTDNAAMIASAGYFKLKYSKVLNGIINPLPNLELKNWD